MAAERNKPFGITPTYDILLRGSDRVPVGLYHLHIATATQLCRLHYSAGTIKTVKARLKTLTDHGYVQHDTIPTRFFRAPYYYALDRKGVQYLDQAGLDVSGSFRPSKEVDKHSLFVEHTLELNDILIAAALLQQSAPDYWLDSFIHERALKCRPYKAVWRGGQFSLIPDAFLDFHLVLRGGTHHRMPVLLEHDRGTEQQQHFRQRIRAYIVLLKTEAYKNLFGARTVTVAFTTFAGARRLEQMRDWTRRELAVTNESKAIGLTFYFTSLNQPLDPYSLWLQPCWYMAYTDGQQPVALLAGE